MASQTGSFKISVGVVNSEAISKLKAMNAELAKAQAPLKAYQRELKKFNDLSGKTGRQKELSNALSSLKGKFGGISSAIGGVIKPLAAVFGVGSIAGVVALERSFANWGNEIRNTSALLGITAEQATKLKNVGNLMGIGDQAAQMRSYQDTQTNIGAGADATGALADRILGINPNTDFEKASLEATKRVNALFKAGKINASAGRNLLKSAGLDESLFGQDPDRLAKSYKNAADAAKQMAPFVKKAGALRDKFAEAGTQVDVLKTRLAASLEPAIGPILQKFIDWSKDNKKVQETMDEITTAAKAVGEWVKNIDVKKLNEGFSTAKSVIESVIIAFGVLKAIQITSWVTSIVADLYKITAALKGVETASELAAGGAGLGALAAGAVAAGAAGYAGYKLYSTYKHDHSDAGIMENRQKMMKDPAYGGNRFGRLEQNQRAYDGIQYLKTKGYSDVQAAAVIGGFKQESGLNEKAIGDKGTAIGLMQAHEDRQKLIEGHFGKKLQDMSYHEQLDAADWELRNNESSAGNQLRKATDAKSATIAMLNYERPKEWNDSKKAGMADNSKELATRLSNTVEAEKIGGNSTQEVNHNISGNVGLHVTMDKKGNVTGAKITHNTTPINPNLIKVKQQTKSGV
ncbi:phage tail tip lysozyme [Gluconobacter frateurii]|uniref:Phage tail lysozyme domain-containing protein n=1 Tax=Gluconobacter frateurii NRIC 0228 TaxID=1307946 RepID=A0ABQ0QFQ2_9PROT|nr:phage tail tip lysozyme [Gluconobacter frateurii]GBR17413.1 hypothetical protein AA0228_3021 [Gluconobacter frateurii NRIC 0228]GLP89598.1 hypothetical protein GCM10007868_06730 [Gluconobacter frateurii]